MLMRVGGRAPRAWAAPFDYDSIIRRRRIPPGLAWRPLPLINAVRMQQAEAQKARRAIEAEEDVGTCDGSCDEPGFENRKCGRMALSVQEDATQQSLCNMQQKMQRNSRSATYHVRRALCQRLTHDRRSLSHCATCQAFREPQVGSAASGCRL